MKNFCKQYLLPVALSVVLTSLGFFFLHGIPLLGLPQAENVSYAEISDPGLSDKPKRVEASDKIEQAVNVANLLNFQLGAPAKEPPVITMTYHLKNGKVLVLSANKTTVYWKDRAYSIKGDNGSTFVNIVEGLFFYEDLVEKEN